MVTDRPPHPTGPSLSCAGESGPATPARLQQLEAWAAPLQQACQLETDRGFVDLMGRRETFSSFVRRCLAEPPPGLCAADLQVLQRHDQQFAAYVELPPERRRPLVVALRQELHLICRRQRPPEPPPAPPRLRLAPLAAAAGAAGQAGPHGAARAAAVAIQPDTPLSQIPGIGPRTAARLAGLGLLLARDLLHHYPRDYLDYADLVRIAALVPGRTATVVATVKRCHAFTSPRNPQLAILELQLQDVTGRMRASRFFVGKRFSSPGWLQAQQRLYPPGATVAASGLVREGPSGPCFRDPLLEVLEAPGAPLRSPQIGRLVPVYALTEGLTAERLRRAIAELLPHLDSWQEETLSQPHRQQLALPARVEALRSLHLPEDRDSLRLARRRLVFDEFLLLQLALGRRRQQWRAQPAAPLIAAVGEADLLGRFRQLLPFAFTEAQERVLAEIRADMARPQAMARLVQGDVGSGKTVVALAALLVAIEAGCQGALLAPTEVLAEQHARRFGSWLPQLHLSCDLLTGSTPMRRRRQLLQDLANGQLHLLVGTHALLEDPVQFQRLGLVVVDEQHRFGVHQRNRLLAKGLQPHLLTMTATPIPRTLALSIHGDLDLSQIDALPPGRTPVQTRLLRSGQRQQAWELVRQEVARGQRAYVVLPLVEESEKLDLRSAVEEHRHLASEVFADLSVGLLHGRLSSEEKQRSIQSFAAGTTQVLVSTTVVEVGVDVPEASVMVIDHAERFGLAQLHQLRGRVGRGAAASHCVLIQSSDAATARQRLELLVRSQDGFEIAEMDLRLRGPGQVLGTRQSGLPDLALASLADDGDVLEEARAFAQRLLAEDPGLERHPRLLAALEDQRRRLLADGRLN